MFSQLAQTLNPFVQNTKWYDINGEGIFKILIYCFQANSTFSRKTGGHSQNFENAAIFIWLVVIPRLRAPWQAAHAQTFFSPVMRSSILGNLGSTGDQCRTKSPSDITVSISGRAIDLRSFSPWFVGTSGRSGMAHIHELLTRKEWH